MPPPLTPEKTRDEVATGLRFLVVGGVATLVHALVALLLVARGFSGQQANALGFAVAWSVSYLGHKYFSFRAGGGHRRQVVRFALTSAALFSASQLGAWAVGSADLPRLGVLVGATIPAGLSYLINRLWVFRSAPPAGRS